MADWTVANLRENTLTIYRDYVRGTIALEVYPVDGRAAADEWLKRNGHEPFEGAEWEKTPGVKPAEWELVVTR